MHQCISLNNINQKVCHIWENYIRNHRTRTTLTTCKNVHCTHLTMPYMKINRKKKEPWKHGLTLLQDSGSCLILSMWSAKFRASCHHPLSFLQLSVIHSQSSMEPSLGMPSTSWKSKSAFEESARFPLCVEQEKVTPSGTTSLGSGRKGERYPGQ